MRGFYSHFSREVPSHNAPNRLLEMVKRGEYPEQMVQELKNAGFTHILFNPAEWERMAYGNRNAPLWVLTALEKEALDSMLRGQTDRVFAVNGVSVHRIRNEQ